MKPETVSQALAAVGVALVLAAIAALAGGWWAALAAGAVLLVSSYAVYTQASAPDATAADSVSNVPNRKAE